MVVVKCDTMPYTRKSRADKIRRAKMAKLARYYRHVTSDSDSDPPEVAARAQQREEVAKVRDRERRALRKQRREEEVPPEDVVFVDDEVVPLSEVQCESDCPVSTSRPNSTRGSDGGNIILDTVPMECASNPAPVSPTRPSSTRGSDGASIIEQGMICNTRVFYVRGRFTSIGKRGEVI